MSFSELPSDHSGQALAGCPAGAMGAVERTEPVSWVAESVRSRVGAATALKRLATVLFLPLLDLVAVAVVVVATGTGLGVGACYALGVLMVLAADGQHRLRICLRVSDQIPRIAAASAVPLVVLVPWVPAPRILLVALCSVVAVVGLRLGGFLALRAAHRRDLLVEPTVIVGSDAQAVELAELLDAHPELGLRSRGLLDRGAVDGSPVLLGDPTDLRAVIERYGVVRVLVCCSTATEEELTHVLRACRLLAVDVVVVPRLRELGMAVSRASLDELWGVPLVPLRHEIHRRAGTVLKRAFDAVAGVVLAVLVAPLLLALAGAVRLTSGRATTLFRQPRVTRTDQLTPVVKLRTVVDDRGATEGWTVSAEQCTPLGRWLRATHFDELPQLVHVMRGDMSLVGPRPERPHFAVRFARSIPHYDDRHRMPGGMTGWAQVNGLHGDTSIPDRARFDNQYIEYWSLWWDAVIVARTIGIVLREVCRPHSRALGGQR